MAFFCRQRVLSCVCVWNHWDAQRFSDEEYSIPRLFMHGVKYAIPRDHVKRYAKMRMDHWDAQRVCHSPTLRRQSARDYCMYRFPTAKIQQKCAIRRESIGRYNNVFMNY